MTFPELRKQFEDVEEDWENRLKAESYKDIEFAWQSKTELHREGMKWMIEYLNAQIFEHLVFELDGKKLEWDEKIFYLFTKEEKLDLIRIRVKELITYFDQQDERGLNPAFYLEHICSPRFPHRLFTDLPEISREKIMEKAKDKHDYDEGEVYSIVFDEMHEFNRLNDEIIEFKYLKTLFEKIQSEGNAEKKNDRGTSSSKVKNEYPEIFTSINSNLLFNYMLQEWKRKEKIGPAIVTKLLEYFKDENKIYKEVKLSHYKNFLEKEHQITLKKLDDRAAPLVHERQIFKNIEENFQIDFNLTV